METTETRWWECNVGFTILVYDDWNLWQWKVFKNYHGKNPFKNKTKAFRIKVTLKEYFKLVDFMHHKHIGKNLTARQHSIRKIPKYIYLAWIKKVLTYCSIVIISFENSVNFAKKLKFSI